MSIWNKELYVGSGPETPVSMRTLRCARIRWEQMPRAVYSGMIGTLVFLAFHLVSLISLRSSMIARSGATVQIKTQAAVSIAETVLAISALSAVSLTVVSMRLLSVFEAKWVMSLSKEEFRFERRVRAFLLRYGAVLSGATAVVIVALYFWRSMVPQLMDVAAWVLAMTGVYWILRGGWGRRGAVLVCRKCEHGMRTWRGAGERCPECHALWKEDRGAMIGVKTVNGMMIFWGVAAIVGSLALALVSETIG